MSENKILSEMRAEVEQDGIVEYDETFSSKTKKKTTKNFSDNKSNKKKPRKYLRRKLKQAFVWSKNPAASTSSSSESSVGSGTSTSSSSGGEDVVRQQPTSLIIKNPFEDITFLSEHFAHSTARTNSRTNPFEKPINDEAKNPFAALRPGTLSLNPFDKSLNPFDDDYESGQDITENPLRLSQTFATHLSKLLQSKHDHSSSMVFLNSREKQAMVAHMNLDFNEALIQALENDSSQSMVTAHLGAARHLCQQFVSLQDLISTTCPMPETMRDTILEALEQYLHPRLSVLYLYQDALTTHETRHLIAWISEEFPKTVAQATLVQSPSFLDEDLLFLETWKRDERRLVSHYLDGAVRSPIQSALKDLFSTADIQVTGDTYLVTGIPEQLTELYDLHVKLVQEELPSIDEPQIWKICHEELLVAVGNMQLDLSSEWKQTDPRTMCGIINDAHCLAKLSQAKQTKPEIYGTSTKLWTDLASLALRFLCEKILLGFWNDDETDLVVGYGNNQRDKMYILISSLKKTFRNLKVWLASKEHYLEVLELSRTFLIRSYLESFFSKTIQNGVRSAEEASEEIHQDFLRLVIFYNGSTFEDVIVHEPLEEEEKDEEGGCTSYIKPSSINEDLRLLQNVSSILSPENTPNDLGDDICAVLERLEQGGPAVLHLAGLVRRYNGTESMEWVKAIAQAEKEIAQKKKPCERSVISIPDLRNSRYIHNVRPLRQLLDRSISNGTKSHAEATLHLLGSN